MQIFRQRALSFVILITSAAGALADATMTWRQDVTGNYATGTNWVGSVAPSSADTAVIGSGTAILFSARPAAVKNLLLNGGSLNLAGYNMGVGGFSGIGGLMVNSGTSLATFTMNSAVSSAYTGSLQDGAGALAFVKQGAGILTLSGSNTFSGGFNLNGGGLILGNASALGTGTLTLSQIATLDATTSLALTGNNAQAWNANFTFKGTGDLDMGAGNVVMNATRTVTVSASTLTVGGGIAGTNTSSIGLTKNGAGTLVLAGANTFRGPLTISTGTLQLGVGGSGASLMSAVVDNGALVVNHSDAQTLANTISGNGRLFKVGSGTLTLSGTNSFSGGTTLNEGSIILGSASALGSSAGSLTVNSGTLDLAGQTARVGTFSGSGGSIGSYSGGAAALNTNSGVSSRYNGLLEDGAGSLALIKGGAGTLTLTQANTYSGGTLLSGGGLDLGNASALGTGVLQIGGTVLNSTIRDVPPVAVPTLINNSGSALTLAANNVQFWNADFASSGSYALNLGTGSVTMNATRSINVAGPMLTVGGVISSTTAAAGLTKTGLGTLVLTQDNTFGGVTTINSGTLQLGVGGTTGSLGTGNVVDNGMLYVNRSSDLTMNQTISGNGRLMKDGTGALTLGGTNSYGSGTVLNDGTLNLGSAKALGAASGDLTVNGGKLNLGANSVTVGLLSGSGGTITVDGEMGSTGTPVVRTLTTNSSKSGTFAGSLTDSGTSAPPGSGGSLTLSGGNLYTGATQIISGTFALSGTTHFSALNISGTNVFVPNLSVLSNTTLITIAAGAILHTSVGDYTGPGTYTYDPTSGTLVSVNNLTPSMVRVIGVTGTLGGGGSTSGTSSGVLTIGSTQFSQGLLALEKAGSGTLTLSGSNSYSGGTILSAGGLNLNNANAIGTGKLTISGAATLDNTSGTAIALATNNAQAWNANFTFKGSSALDLGTGDVMMNATRTVTVTSNTLTVGGAISGSTATTGLTKSGTGTLVLAGNNAYTGVTTISQGTLQLGNGGTSGSVMGNVVDNATLALNRSDDFTLANTISGAGKLVQNGLGTVTVTGTNTYTGGTIVNSGSLVVGNSKALGAATGDLTVNAGIVDLQKNNITVGALSGSGGGIYAGGGGYDVPSGTTTLTTNTSKSTVMYSFLRDEPMQYSGGGGGGVIIIGPGTPVFQPQILSLVKAGSGTLTLAGNNDYSGDTFLMAGGLNLVDGYSLGKGVFRIEGVSTLDNVSGVAFTSYGGGAQAWDANFTFKGSSSLAFDLGQIVLNGNRTVTVVSNTLSYAGDFVGATATSGLTKSGTGTLVLGGNNSYGGNTTVTAGTLQFSGSLGAGTIANNGTLLADIQGDIDLKNTINGSGKFVKDDTGTLTLSGTNSYTGGTVLNDGRLNLGNAKALGAATGDLTVNGGALNLNGNTVTIGALSGTGGFIGTDQPSLSKLITNSSKSGNYSGDITDGGGIVALEKAGSGTLTLSGSNEYSGGTILSGGGLNLNNAKALGGNSINGNGLFTIAGVTTIDNTSGSAITLTSNTDQAWNSNFTFKGSDALDLGTGDVMMNATRTVTVASSTLTVGGVISGSTATTGLTKSGTGTLVLAGNNIYGGATTISQGTLQLGNGGTTGSLGAGAVANNATFALNRSDDITLANVISGVGRFVKNGAGAVTLAGANTYSGGTVINQGAVTLGNAKALGSASGDLTMNGGSLDLGKNNVTVGLLSGTGGVIKASGGVVTTDPAQVSKLTTNSSKSGTFAGSLQDEASSGGGLVLTGSNVFLFPSSASSSGNNLSIRDTIIIIGGGGGSPTPTFQPQRLALEKAGAGTLTLTGSSSYSGGTTLTAGGLNLNSAYAIGTGALTISGVTTLDNTSGTAVALATGNAQNWNANFTFKGSNDLDLGGGGVMMNATRTITVASHTLTVGGVVSGSTATTGLTKAGAGTLVLANYTGYTGVTTISAGTLQLGNGGNGGGLSGAVVNNGTLVADASNTMTFGPISGRGSLVQNGSGMVYLDKVNTYSGGTVVNAGTFIVANEKALGSGNVTLNGGYFGTDGNPGVINVNGDLFWKSTAKIGMVLTGESVWGMINVKGSLRALDDGPLTFIFNFPSADSGTFTVLNSAHGFGDLTAADFAYESDISGFSGHFEIQGNSLEFVGTMAAGGASGTDLFSVRSPSTSSLSSDSFNAGAVPEPSTYALLALALAALPFLRRRRSAGF